MKKTCLALALAAALLSGCDPDAGLDDAAFLARAESRLEAHDISGAVIDLKNALQVNPGNARARWTLGLVYLEAGEWPLAEKELLQAQAQGVLPESVRPVLAQVLVLQGRNAEALEVAPEPGFSRETRAQILASHAIAHHQAGDSEAARRVLAQAEALDGDAAYVRLAGAHTLLGTGGHARARELAAELTESHPDYLPGWTMAGELAQEAGDLRAAAAAYGEILEHQPWNINARSRRAVALAMAGDEAGARADLAIIEKDGAGVLLASYAHGLLALRAGDPAAAAGELKPVADDPGAPPAALYHAALANLAAGNAEQGEAYLRSLLARHPDVRQARRLLGRVLIGRQRHHEAAEVLAVFAGAAGDDQRLLAAALIGAGRGEEAVRMLEQAGAPGDSARADLATGIGLLALGDEAEAMVYLGRAAAENPDAVVVDEYLVLHALRKGDRDLALTRAEAYRARLPQAPGPHVLLGLVRHERGDAAQASEAYARAAAIEPGHPDANLSLASLALARSDWAAAQSAFVAVLAHHPDHLGALQGMAGLQARRGDAAGFEQWLRRAITAHPEAALPRVTLAQLRLSRGEPRRALEILEPAAQRITGDPRFLTTLGLARAAAGDLEKAKLAFTALIAVQPDSARAHHLLARVLMNLDALPAARRELAHVIELDPRDFQARADFIRLSLWEGDYGAAERAVAPLREAIPDHPEVVRLAALVAAAREDTAEARTLLARAVQERPTSDVVLVLAQQRYAEGDVPGALETLEDWLAVNPEDGRARLSLAATYAATERVPDAVAQYARVLEQEPGNLVALNNLAWHLLESDPPRAVQHAARAVELDPDSPEVMDTLVAAHLANGDQPRAAESLDRALLRHPADPQLLYRRAVMLSAAGDEEAARQILRRLVDGDAGFSRKAEARELLTRLGG